MSAGNPQGAIDRCAKCWPRTPIMRSRLRIWRCACTTRVNAGKQIRRSMPLSNSRRRTASFDMPPEPSHCCSGDTVLPKSISTQRAGCARREARVYRLLAQLYDETGRQQRSLATLQDGLKHEPADPGLRTDVGLRLLRKRPLRRSRGHGARGLGRRSRERRRSRAHGRNPVALRWILPAPGNMPCSPCVPIPCTTARCGSSVQSSFRQNPLLRPVVAFRPCAHRDCWIGSRDSGGRLLPIPAICLTTTLLHSRNRSSLILLVLWLGVLGYLWAGGIIFERMIKRELRFIRLRSDF